MHRRFWVVGGGRLSATLLPMMVCRGPTKVCQFADITLVARQNSVAYQSAKALGIAIDDHEFGASHLDHAQKGDTIVNLAGLPSLVLADLCRDRGLHYIDTQLNRPFQTSLHAYNQIKSLQNYKQHRVGPTALFAHGSAPGLVSHLTKAALLKIAHQENIYVNPLTTTTKAGWATLAERLGVAAVQIVDRDNQRPSTCITVRELQNTWSTDGFFKLLREAPLRALPGPPHIWTRPSPPIQHHSRDLTFERNMATHFGPDRVGWSWEPMAGCFAGTVASHMDVPAIADMLTSYHHHGAKVAYRPEVEHIYRPCPPALKFLLSNERRTVDKRVDTVFGGQTIEGGYRSVGVHVTVRRAAGSGAIWNRSWWYGNTMTVEMAQQRLDTFYNAFLPAIPIQPKFSMAQSNVTYFQTAVSLLAGLKWLLEHPDRGLCLPEDIEHPLQILDTADHWLSGFSFTSVPSS